MHEFDLLEFVKGYYAYIFLIVLIVIGMYGMMMKENLMKKVLGMSIVQTSVILFWVLTAFKEGATVPVKDYGIPVHSPENYMSPLPHTLMLTAIVVAVVTLGVAFALIVALYKRYHTLDESVLLDRMK
jgi:multicomponent Na+:H+ antiporter subunit C